MERIKILTEYDYDDLDHTFAPAYYRRAGNGDWEVNTASIDGEGWRTYAYGDASAETLCQLLRKEYDERY